MLAKPQILFGFGEIESSMYKRHRKQLPSAAEDVLLRTVGTSYATCTRQEFYRGSVSIDDSGFVCIFTTQTQLNLWNTNTDLFADETFQTVPEQFYKIFTLFVEINRFEPKQFYQIFTLFVKINERIYYSNMLYSNDARNNAVVLQR